MAKVNFIRRHTDVEVDEEPIVDGNFIVTGDGNIYIDYGLERIKIVGGGGGSATGDTLPIGSITAYGKETAPANWLICDGSEVNRTTYSDLFKVIGTKYGEGDGSTTFNLPNLKGRVPVGLDGNDTDFGTIGKTGGEKIHLHDLTSGAAQIKTNLGSASGGYVAKALTPYTTNRKFLLNGNSSTDTDSMSEGVALTGDTGDANSLQPYEVNNFIIKAFQSAGVVANVVKTKFESDNDVYSCNYINNVMQNNILGVSLTANVDPQISTYVEINTWKQQLKIGDKLNVENGKIKIGAGVNYIKIYGQLGINSDGDALFYMWLKKNGNNVGVWEVNRTFNTYVIIPINQILQVEEGDIISMATYQNAKYTIEVEKTEVYFEAIYQ